VLGLFLPWLTGVAPVLTPAAAAGLGIVMIGAAAIHLRLREPLSALANAGILALCAFVAPGRAAQL
jgi:hypothetical protein